MRASAEVENVDIDDDVAAEPVIADFFIVALVSWTPLPPLFVFLPVLPS